ncbi:MAG: arabinan endo-1,5-alpha-L-arabinosidase [Thermoguttaceae bacterium]
MTRASPLGFFLLATLVGGLTWGQVGDIYQVHDPAIAEQDGRYYVFGTGRGIPFWQSDDLYHWRRAGRVLDRMPDWAAEHVPTARDHWAPDISFFAGEYHLYYAVSEFGTQRSVIGLATNKTLDPANADYRWVDRGPVIRTTPDKDQYNAIDGQAVVDHEGRLWLALGSFWSGIKLIELDPRTGKVMEGAKMFSLASRPEEKAVEAPYIVRHGGFYYLFVSFDQCCRGVDSTYNLRVGRSAEIAGPYADDRGRSMLEGGGRVVLDRDGSCIGPGHNSVLCQPGRQWLVHHYYDGEHGGLRRLQIRPLTWSDDGWPLAGPPIGGPVTPASANSSR